jgi:hypothetical protein
MMLGITIFFAQETPQNGLRQAIAGQAVLLTALLAQMYNTPFARRVVNGELFFSCVVLPSRGVLFSPGGRTECPCSILVFYPCRIL